MKTTIAVILAALVLAGCGSDPVTYGRGFYGPEAADDGSTFRWMGPEGVIQLKNASSDMVLTIAFNLPLDKLAQPPVIRIELNGTLLEEFTPAEQTIERTFAIPTARQGTGATSELHLRTTQTFAPREVSPQSADIRRLGLVLHTVSWAPK